MILDASVAAKWFLPDEPFLHEAREVRTAVLAEVVDLAAPATLWTEISNAIVRAVRRGRVDADLAVVVPKLRLPTRGGGVARLPRSLTHFSQAFITSALRSECSARPPSSDRTLGTS